MATKKTTVNVVLKAPTRMADFLVFVQKVHDQMAVNAKSLPSPNPTLVVFQGQIDDLTTKEALAKTRANGAVGDRDQSRAVVKASLASERAYVEGLCNADAGNALVLAQDAGMSLRVSSPRNKPPLAVKAGTVSGTVQIVAKATKGAKTNLWQYSLDGGKTWIDLPPTTRASTALTSLTPGTTVTVRQRSVTKAGLTDWAQPVSHLVT